MNTAPHIKPVPTQRICVPCVLVWTIAPLLSVAMFAALAFYLA